MVSCVLNLLHQEGGTGAGCIFVCVSIDLWLFAVMTESVLQPVFCIWNTPQPGPRCQLCYKRPLTNSPFHAGAVQGGKRMFWHSRVSGL